jgi:hypothetical protein
MLKKSQRTMLSVLAVILFAVIGLMQTGYIDKHHHQFEPGTITNTNKAVSQLPIEFALGALTGFREVVAGLLWVRADEFFHNGDYESVVPIVRIITWIDPHQIDVYTTGAWHMDYNFTDEANRSDRRYIPLSLALLEEGIVNNPETTEISSDLGFVHYYRKIIDLPAAEKAFRGGQENFLRLQKEADAHPNDQGARKLADGASLAVINWGHGLAHVLASMGRIDESVAEWKFCLERHHYNLEHKIGFEVASRLAINAAEKQLYEAETREKWRKLLLPKEPLVDMKFSAQLVRVAPRIFVCKGTMNVIGAKDFILKTGEHSWQPTDGARVDIRLNDEGYKMRALPGLTLRSFSEVPPTTIMQDTVQVNGGVFERKIDMAQNPEIYTFDARKYTVTVSFNPANPQNCPANVQDRIGWLGEFMTDKNYLDTSGTIPGDAINPIPGLRILKKTFTVTRDDLLGQGRKVFN